ncbi:MAG: 2-C-methyl-D-erythritol 4-phosphate cytidylyltransferase [Clostridiales Family XIII bacterium]|nr:2-C-methyl-D-erythritol 4-phosphate cytidylyltransferase [Clostridiales Family XIII bacterium]
MTVLIMAAGTGSRLGASAPKQFIDIGGEPMILKSARAFEECDNVDRILAVASQKWLADTDASLGSLYKYEGSIRGGSSRQESVLLGLRATVAAQPRGSGAIVLIHDAARPFVTPDIIERVLAGAAATGATVACVPVTDTIYMADGEPECGRALSLSEAPTRGLLWSVQTPQGFDLDMILRAHEAAALDGFEATDDGAIARAYGGAHVLIAMGGYANRKITTPEDLIALARPGAEDRVGIGFDVHAFVSHSAYPAGCGESDASALVLGGVAIPYGRTLEGHSDADVLTHALMDAILGALALGDIGKFFPDTDEKYRNISSMKLLVDVIGMARREGYIVYNADMTIIAEKPRMAAHTDDIRDSLAFALGVGKDRIGVKATTTEGLGVTGREEGIGAQAVVRLVRAMSNGAMPLSQPQKRHA